MKTKSFNKRVSKTQLFEDVKLRKRLKKLFSKDELRVECDSNEQINGRYENVIYNKPLNRNISKNQEPVKKNKDEKFIKKSSIGQSVVTEKQYEESSVAGRKHDIKDKQQKDILTNFKNVETSSKIKTSKSNQIELMTSARAANKSKLHGKSFHNKKSKQSFSERSSDKQPRTDAKKVKETSSDQFEIRQKKARHEPLIISKKPKVAAIISHNEQNSEENSCSDSWDNESYSISDSDDECFVESFSDCNNSDEQNSSYYEYSHSSDEERFSDESNNNTYIDTERDSYNFEDTSDDEDYHLPENVPEDLIIHKGTAEKRALVAEDNVKFDSDNEEAQIVELPSDNIETNEQSKFFHIEKLQKLNEVEVRCSFIKKQICGTDTNGGIINDLNVCPQLVSMTDNGCFELYDSGGENSCSENSCYSKINSDESSIIEDDINNKYLATNELSDFEEKQLQMKADVVNAENCDYNNISAFNFLREDDHIEQLPSDRLSKQANNINNIDAEIVSAIVFESGEILEKSLVDDTLNIVSTDTFMSEDLLIVTSEGITNSTFKLPDQVNRSIFCNAVDSNHVLVLLKEPIFLYGTLRMTLVAGSVEVYGYLPRIGEELEIFSPRGCSSVSISPISNHAVNVNLENNLKRFECHFTQKDLQHIAAEFEENDGVLLLQRNIDRKKLTNFFKKYMNENVFPNMNSIKPDRPFYASEYFLQCVINFKSEKALIVPKDWSALQFDLHSKVMIVGGKSVGKSTLLRYLVNSHLTQFKKVLLIDLDIGQGEIFVPQTISCMIVTQPLLGPSFFLNKQPDRAYMVGHSNIILCAHQYLRAVKQLVNYCNSNEEFKQIPWFINTMGYNKGFGMELMGMIARIVNPTDLVQLQSNKEINNFDSYLEPQVLITLPQNVYMNEEFKPLLEDRELQYCLHVLNSATPQQSRYQREWDMSAKDLRYAIVLARLSEALQGNAETLTDCKPLSASLNDLKILNMLSKEPSMEEVLQAIEVNLVFICKHPEDIVEPLQCFGIGVVRAIDYHGQQVFLLPAMPLYLLKFTNCLAIGEMPLPSSLFTNQGSKVRNQAPFVHNTVDAKSSKSIKQIYRRPPQFLTGKHKNILKG